MLVDALRALPAPPVAPTGAGEVLAVVGDGHTAWASAIELAERLGLDPDQITLIARAGSTVRVPAARRVDTVEAAQARGERWRKRPTASITVIDTSMAPSSVEWSRDVLDALQPTATWAVVPATSKTHDIAIWLDRLDSADALIVTNVEGSADPASVLGLGVPVATIEGRTATAGAWAGLVIERMIEAA